MWFGDLLGAVGRITTALDPPAFRDTNSITIPSVGTTNPPPTVNVSGLQGTVTGITARLTGISHTFPDDLNVLLQGPQGQTVMLASDVGSAVSSRQGDLGGTKKSYPADGITLNFTDAAPRRLSDTDPLVSGFYKPTNITDPNEGGPPEMDSPGTAHRYDHPLLDLDERVQRNQSQRHVDPVDHRRPFGRTRAKIYGGWGLDITTTGPPATQAPPATVGTVASAPRKSARRSAGARSPPRSARRSASGAGLRNRSYIGSVSCRTTTYW